MSALPQLDSFKALERHHAEVAPRHLRELFAADAERGTALSAEACGLYLDYSKNRVTAETIDLLAARGRKCFYTTPIKALSNQKYTRPGRPVRRRPRSACSPATTRSTATRRWW